MPYTIKTHIVINASAEKIWQVLTDFDRYPEWNPFVKAVVGDFRVGGFLQVCVEPPEGKIMIFNPTVTKIEPRRQLIWQNSVYFPGLFDGEQSFELEPLKTGHILFHHSESFNGLLTRLILKLIAQSTEAGFHAMNLALKKRVEEDEK